jgi:hypothetical protein
MKKLIIPLFLFIMVFQASAQTNGQLTVTTTTSSAGGQYANKNCFAIWVQNSAGVLINTMMYYTNNGDNSGADLSVWYGLIGSWANRNVKKNVDGISGATQASHGTRTCYWGKTVNLSTVPDGVYTVKLELTDAAGAAAGATGHKLVTYTFTKGRANSTGTISGAAQTCFSNTSVTWTPNFTAIDEVKLGNLYSVYPNPTKQDIFVNGSDIEGIEIFTLAGKSILKTNQQKVNLSTLERGSYLAQVTTAKGTFIKKIIKE